ncbi:MAG: DNA-binding protein [Geobacter sp.]|nr:MAG: DNA-binding protein [Geobacter sp.]
MRKMASMLAAALMISAPVLGVCSDAPKGSPGVMAVNNGVTGKVVETTTAGDYTYINLEKDGKRAWVACPPLSKVTLGQQMAFTGCTPMMDFESKALNKTFDLIMFCGMPLSETAAELLGKKSTGSSGLVPEAKEKIVVEMAKAPNSHSIADLYEKSGELDQKTVVVTGKVMKVSTNIMGRNWLHLQDGTGSALQKNNDLVVTTKDLPKVGDVVTVTGTLANNRDFGSGYKYAVILESASLQK